MKRLALVAALCCALVAGYALAQTTTVLIGAMSVPNADYPQILSDLCVHYGIDQAPDGVPLSNTEKRTAINLRLRTQLRNWVRDVRRNAVVVTEPTIE